MKFVDPKNDVAFKKIFGNSSKTEILVSFLNAVLELPSPIASLTIATPYQIPQIEELKYTSLDVKAVDNNGREFIVEMQVEGNEKFGKRALYYLAKNYVAQIKVAEDYEKLKPAYFVGILNFNMFEGDNCLTRHIFINQETKHQDLKDFEFNFIELRKFNKSDKEIVTIVDKWLFFLKNAGTLDVIPSAITELALLEAFDSANQMKWTPKELEAFDYWSGKEGDRKAQLRTAENKGIAKGKAEGLAEGLAEGKKSQAVEIAINCFKQGMASDSISRITGLSVSEVENLAQKTV